jgi:cyclophilin family peptidyl-prolyl cis-trans isomerase/HEAT repeat protein
MKRIFILLLSVTGIVACENSPEPNNKFSDPILLKIADLQDRRLTDSLYQFLEHQNKVYRQASVLAFASIQDSSAVQRLASVLTSDADTTVRKAAAVALGQAKSRQSAETLNNALYKEPDAGVVREILYAYGKVTKKWIVDRQKVNDKEGTAWSLYAAGLNNTVDASANEIAAELLSDSNSEKTRLGAAHYFARGAKDFEQQLSAVIASAQKDLSPDVRMATTSALRKVQNDTVFNALERILKDEPDYRVRVSAVRALQNFKFERSKDLLLKSLKDKNTNAGVAASEVVLASVTEDFWVDLANLATNVKDWRIQANIYEAVLKVKENKGVIDEITSAFQNSKNPYQKAALLTSLQQSMNSVSFIEQELFEADTPVVRSSAASALVTLNKNKKFRESDKPRFVEIYKKAIQTGDAAVIGIIAGTLGDSTLNYREIIKDFSFLNEAKQKLSLPKDNEALQPLEAAISYFEKRKISAEVKNEFNHPIDWELVKRIPKDQLAVIKTSRGNITIRLFVEDAPGSVANFISLARQHYFDRKFFHRVVPNFVIQAGCNRGDGWGSEDYSIRSEFSERRYKTGSVGMASAGKDTEGTQWFITHSPTPHLNGRYTIFAEVTEGMQVVDLIQVGDQILEVEIKSTKKD